MTAPATITDSGLRRLLAARSPGCGMYVETGERQPSLEALRWACEIRALLGEPVEPGSITFIAACRRGNEAYAMHVERHRPELGATYYAVRVLALAGHADQVPAAMAGWLDGTVFGAAGIITVDADDLFYAIRALEQAGLTPAAERTTRIAEFLRGCQHPAGGFGLVPGAPPDVERTYCCLAIDHFMARTAPDWPDPVDRGRHARWLRTCLGPVGIRMAPTGPANPATQYWGVQAFRLAGIAPDPVVVRDAVDRARHPDGGFGAPTLWHSYCALRVLRLLDEGGAE